MQTSSPQLAANLSRLAVETYVDSNYSIVVDTLFKNKKIDPNLFLLELEDKDYKLPKKTRDIYLYLPYRMLKIFPTVAVFGNLDLLTGSALRRVVFYPTKVRENENGLLTFRNGIQFEAKKGELIRGGKRAKIEQFIITQNTKEGKVEVQTQYYHRDGEYVIIYMQSYGQFIVLDKETVNSMYVQMFILGKYDKSLFELVVSSPYSKTYKLKK
jgi:dolichyl-diphosphooligosaccharide--protein glycosyltransferase/undecaprenyl-diphosphooligosaccharide--protein glycosyltransferase